MLCECRLDFSNCRRNAQFKSVSGDGRGESIRTIECKFLRIMEYLNGAVVFSLF